MATTVLIAVAVFIVPGFLISLVSGLKFPWAIAAAIPVTFGVYGLGAWLYGELDIRYTASAVTWFSVIVALITLLWRGIFAFRRLRVRRRSGTRGSLDDEPEDTSDDAAGDDSAEESSSRSRWWRTPLKESRSGGLLDPRWLLPAAGSIVGAWLLIDRALDLQLQTRRGLEDIFQGWDVHWHASMVRFMGEEGIASATRMGELRNIETGADLFYPSAWHVGAWLVGDFAGISPIAATNLTGIVLPGVLIPLSVATIAWRLLNNRGITAQLGAGLGAIAVMGSPVLFWIGSYVGAWPYVAAIGTSGIVLALFMSLPSAPIRSLAAVIAFTGMIQLHPAPATIVVLALALWWLLYLVWSPSRKVAGIGRKALVRLRDLGVLAGAGVVACLLLLPQLLSGSEQTEDVLAYTAEEDVSRAESWWKSIEMNTRHVDAFGDIDLTVVLVFAAIGGVVALVWRRNLWAPVFYALSVWLTANSLLPFDKPWGDWLGLIGGLHYASAHRLVMPVALFTFAAAGIGLAAIIRIICLGFLARPSGRFSAWAATSAAASVALGSVVAVPVGTWAWKTVEEGSNWSITSLHDDRMVSAADLRAFDWIAEQPKGRELRVFGDPADGHGWMYAYNGLPSVHRHYTWPHAGEGTATAMLFWWPQLLGMGNNGDPDRFNDVDDAAVDLDVGFIMVSPPIFWWFQEPNLRLWEETWETPGLTPVYLDEGTVIFAINQAFTDEELDQMRAPGNSPEQLPPVPTKDELGLAETVDDFGRPHYQRPTVPSAPSAEPVGSPNLNTPHEPPATPTAIVGATQE